MDNDTLINQARLLYAALLNKRFSQAMENGGADRLDHLIRSAECRYVRRLNRCAICYLHRLYDCNREPGKDHTPCERRLPPDA